VIWEEQNAIWSVREGAGNPKGHNHENRNPGQQMSEEGAIHAEKRVQIRAVSAGHAAKLGCMQGLAGIARDGRQIRFCLRLHAFIR
jgi:hypothetical protein